MKDIVIKQLRFHGLDCTNTMGGQHTGLQHRLNHDALQNMSTAETAIWPCLCSFEPKFQSLREDDINILALENNEILFC